MDTFAYLLAEAGPMGNLEYWRKLKDRMELVEVPVVAEVFAGLQGSCYQTISHPVVDNLCCCDHTQAQQQQ